MDIYQQNILDHYKNPRYFGEIDDADHTKCLENPSCGDKICIATSCKFFRFSGSGCAISMATADILLEYVIKNKLTFRQILRLKKENILDLIKIDLQPVRLKCALLPLEVLQKMLAEIEKK
ncbi:iron-sulfur cluster assembly scaffold protein [Candidatus Microgenomates bacterium]|nr:iron-sulfur cluster assembly scaffold protein [Candidatus Microgenomates bacterium]